MTKHTPHERPPQNSKGAVNMVRASQLANTALRDGDGFLDPVRRISSTRAEQCEVFAPVVHDALQSSTIHPGTTTHPSSSTTRPGRTNSHAGDRSRRIHHWFRWGPKLSTTRNQSLGSKEGNSYHHLIDSMSQIRHTAASGRSSEVERSNRFHVNNRSLFTRQNAMVLCRPSVANTLCKDEDSVCNMPSTRPQYHSDSECTATDSRKLVRQLSSLTRNTHDLSWNDPFEEDFNQGRDFFSDERSVSSDPNGLVAIEIIFSLEDANTESQRSLMSSDNQSPLSLRPSPRDSPRRQQPLARERKKFVSKHSPRKMDSFVESRQLGINVPPPIQHQESLPSIPLPSSYSATTPSSKTSTTGTSSTKSHQQDTVSSLPRITKTPVSATRILERTSADDKVASLRPGAPSSPPLAPVLPRGIDADDGDKSNRKHLETPRRILTDDDETEKPTAATF